MADQFVRQPVKLESPGRQFFSITPNATTDIPLRPRALYVGSAGDINCIDETGVTTLFTNMAAGWHPIGPVRILVASTTASGIVGVV